MHAAMGTHCNATLHTDDQGRGTEKKVCGGGGRSSPFSRPPPAPWVVAPVTGAQNRPRRRSWVPQHM